MNDKRPLDETLKQALDTRSESLDNDTLSELRRARMAAVDAATRPSLLDRFRFNSWALPAGAVATLFAAAIGLGVWLHTPTSDDVTIEPRGSTAIVMVELAAADVDIALLEEIDFYDWLVLFENDGDSV